MTNTVAENKDYRSAIVDAVCYWLGLNNLKRNDISIINHYAVSYGGYWDLLS